MSVGDEVRQWLRLPWWNNYPEKILDPGEEIVVHTRPHWVMLVRPSCLSVLVVAVGALLLGLADHMEIVVARQIVQAGVGLLMAVLLWRWLVIPVVVWLGASIVVTTHRVVSRQGVFRKETLSVSLAWLQAVEVQQRLLGRMLGYGTVVVSSYELGGLHYDQVPHPHEVESLIRQGSEELQRTGVYPQY